jgi:hypothetical protein
LNPNHTKVIKYSKQDEENRYAMFADANERKGSIAEIERRASLGSAQAHEKA